jgi:gliding motility-associated-like protein
LGQQLTVQHNLPNATYSWTPSGNLNAANIQSPTILADVSATYTVTVTDPNGCSVSDQVVVTRAFNGVPASQNASACANTPPTLNSPATGTSYQWSTGAITPSIVAPTSGAYTLTITNAQGCQVNTTFNVSLWAVPVVDLGPDQALCGQTGTTLNAGNAGATYLWNTGATTQSIGVSSSGSYSVTVTNANNCTAGDAVNIQLNALPVDVLQDVTACITAPPTLNAGNNGSSYLWSNGATTASITPATSGTYSVTVTTPQSCSATFDAVVTLAPALAVDLGPDLTICPGETVTLNVGNNGNTILWSTGATTSSIVAGAAGTYSVTVSNAACTASDATQLTVSPGPVDVLADVSRCVDEPITLDAGNAGSTYLWNTGSTLQTIAAQATGSYSVQITTSNGCTATFDAQVEVIAPPVVALGTDTVLCEGQTLVLDAGNAGGSHTWNTGATSQMINVTQPGTYSVQVNNGCIRADSITVLFNPSPARMAVREFHTCLDDEPRYVVLDAGNTGSQFQWSTGQSTQVIMASAYGWYYVHVTNAYDCAGRDSAHVVEYCPATIFVPNTFTPNGDGLNDVFIPVGKSIASIHLMIFDRWGELLYETDDMDMGWDGTYRGELVKNDMYAWRLTYRFYTDKDGKLGQEQQQMGHIQVLR